MKRRNTLKIRLCSSNTLIISYTTRNKMLVKSSKIETQTFVANPTNQKYIFIPTNTITATFETNLFKLSYKNLLQFKKELKK